MEANDRKKAGPPWGLLLGAAAAIAVALSRVLIDGIRYAAPCPFRDTTGVPCPTCFGLRSLAALGRGDIAGALEMNPLVAGGAILALLWGAFSLAFRITGRRPPAIRLSKIGARVLLWAIAAAALLGWAYLVRRG